MSRKVKLALIYAIPVLVFVLSLIALVVGVYQTFNYDPYRECHCSGETICCLVNYRYKSVIAIAFSYLEGTLGTLIMVSSAVIALISIFISKTDLKHKRLIVVVFATIALLTLVLRNLIATFFPGQFEQNESVVQIMDETGSRGVIDEINLGQIKIV